MTCPGEKLLPHFEPWWSPVSTFEPQKFCKANFCSEKSMSPIFALKKVLVSPLSYSEPRIFLVSPREHWWAHWGSKFFKTKISPSKPQQFLVWKKVLVSPDEMSSFEPQWTPSYISSVLLDPKTVDMELCNRIRGLIFFEVNPNGPQKFYGARFCLFRKKFVKSGPRIFLVNPFWALMMPGELFWALVCHKYFW